ncbi:MAG: bifunctional 23S rRNA (guanine(2069)-N(7))-methyltransferase RlmK/23S rRNA (guanine(2445)-N(2))-methyltransferase RlmL [Atopobiaceae bacterium]|jgi:23S rRNA (guanine2445-N2)-methyltransferase / 23S rRNA (guanine2069-N7)-methyltransferase|nr:bifunctional 23S rRNA (guanine(2069)-N(7))-methyltransferase RlmK/23S rRNA (guanine(2445)-N(2))-methyltransferase RlmL [Atopobiaceae bacterium]MCH4215142.1 bifunctional 23S rRNA (guanine(2069)-N(7))-methyltransferase RlmK/23S rRNA (guanine(2445)-N(2))-methyltransferase RlmL [Atopobiaceae bacterium]MCH4230248.1 bifunctional 23S rRNA (guanine(2069)-N(7))-methyltransferase RlmK/23S rRNA (guanine(2445)-N(2))-methyltransferase RlmL [Atopobiaceae bacterium]MCH4276709.1 bifunctional 23S rRNA (guanin
MEFFATCPKGFEQLLAAELTHLGMDQVRALAGQVSFAGDVADAERAVLWSRLASRVVAVLARRVPAHDSDALYEGLSAIPWEDHLRPTSTLEIDAHGTNQELRNTRFVALRTKDAVSDRLLARTGARPETDTRNPDLRVVVRLRNDAATVGIDLSGDALFKRGVTRPTRSLACAPLRADYAAALLAAGDWFRDARHGSQALMALYAGTGTIACEAAEQVCDRAPGLLRTRWGHEGWLGADRNAWQALLDEADNRAENGAGRLEGLSILVADPRPGTADACRQALRSAGLAVTPTIVETTPAACREALAQAGTALVTADLSWFKPDDYAQEASVTSLVSSASQAASQGSRLCSLGRAGLAASALGIEPAGSYAVITGSDAAAIDRFEGLPTAATPTITLKDGTTVPVLVGASDQFAARLAKVARLRAKWARREDVSCYRVYDADLPDYAVAIDLYQGTEATPGRWLVIAEYAAPKEIDPELAHRRLLDVLAIAPRVLGVAPADVSLKVRERARGGSQYADGGQHDARPTHVGRDHHRGSLRLAPGSHLVDEGGLTFEVDLRGRLDTGLFLDHRLVRSEVREMAKQTKGSKRFLNLFAYTGTATVYAADGSATHTTTVDMSAPYLEWARRNMARNGFTGEDHEFVQADVIAWVSEQRHTANRWDLIFCDPPTFSNSSRMRDASFDIQRDHAELLIGVSRLLTRNGTCLFSCNLRGFEPDVEKLGRAGVGIEDVTAGTIPEDFSRNARIHHCYLVRRIPPRVVAP